MSPVSRVRGALRGVRDGRAGSVPSAPRVRESAHQTQAVFPDARAGLLLFCVLLAIYSANGREIGSYDSQPTKFAARELLLRGTLALNYVVGAEPLLLDRHAFVQARDGQYRSAYSPVPAIAAAAITWPAWKIGAIDVRGAQGAKVIAVLAASVQAAAAVVLAFFTVRRRLPRGAALALAFGLGLGTGYWHTVSQTLWQHETAILGLALAICALTAMQGRTAGFPLLLLAGAGLALAVTSRMQLAAAVTVLLAGTLAALGWRRALLPLAITAASVALLVAINVDWYGSVFGGVPHLLTFQPTVHLRMRSFEPSIGGFAGLLFSPNRGLLIYSPVVAVALGAVLGLARQGWRSISVWCALAALAQYAFYASYSVWWAGHTYGPRYMLDVLPLLVPLAASALASARVRHPLFRAFAVPALAWSILVAGTGAFVYPDERWNVVPADVDRHHERLWDWSDMQIVRCWRAGGSSRNFELFEPTEP